MFRLLSVMSVCWMILGGFVQPAMAQEPPAKRVVAQPPATRVVARPAAKRVVAPRPAKRVVEAARSYQSVVTAKRSPEDPFRSGRSLTVVGRRELRERAPRSLPEALWDSAGVFVQQTNHGGGSPILRGMVGPQVLILVDGVRLNNSVYRTGPVQYLNLIDPYSIDRIEVLRGPGSVLYGSDAMGGVIQVFGAKPDTSGGRDGFHFGGRALQRFSSAELGLVNHVRAEVGYNGFGVLGGWTLKSLSNMTGGRGVGEQSYSGYNHWSAMGAVEQRIQGGLLSGWKVRMGYLLARIHNAGRTDKLYTKNSLQMYDNFDDLVYGQIHARFRPLRTRGRLILSYQRFFERKDSSLVADDFATVMESTRDETQVHTLGADLQLRSLLWGRRLQLQYGGMWYHDNVGSSRQFRSAGDSWARLDSLPYPDGSSYHNWGAHALVTGVPVRAKGHELHLTAGYRLHGMRGEAPSQLSLPAVSFSHVGHVAHGSVRYIYRDRAVLAATFSQGFRAPNLFEAVMLGDSGQFFHVPNADLGPERSDTMELLFRGRFGRVRFGYTFYATLLHSLIKRDFTTYDGQTEVGGKPVTWNVNAGRGLMFGMASTLKIRMGRGFSLGGHLTYTWGEQWVDDGMDLPLRLVPPLFGGARLRYDMPAFGKIRGYAQTSIRGAGKQSRLSPEDIKDSRIPDGGTEGWAVWNLRVGAHINRHVRVTLAVDNLTNNKYRYHGSGLWAPGTNVMLTAEGDLSF